MTTKQLEDIHNYMISEIENSGGKISRFIFVQIYLQRK